jgi:methylphosphotriester-DNA--protein-cysteine methyltransferase
MQLKRKPITDAKKELKANLDTVARVYEWAELMNYKKPKLFARHFLRHWGKPPSAVMVIVRLKSIIAQLRNTDNSCFQIARMHGMTDEKALNNFVNRHLSCSPTRVKAVKVSKLDKLIRSIRK